MRQSPAEWHKTVMLMVAFGAQLFPEDAATITKYLSTYLSDRAALAGESEKARPMLQGDRENVAFTLVVRMELASYATTATA